MAIVTYARRFTCDSCMTAADVVEPWTVPEGWIATGLQLSRTTTLSIDLCPVCSAVPFSEMIQKLKRHFEIRELGAS
jgi:hypothetical protein